MTAAKAKSHVIGPTRFFSGSAVERHMAASPLSLCLIDEYGRFLSNVTGAKASSHERAVSDIFTQAWGTSFNAFTTGQRAQEGGVDICCPAQSILGMSTPGDFYGALQGDSETNGFMNRHLALACKAGSRQVPLLDARKVPEGLAEALCALYLWTGPQSLLRINDPDAEHEPDILPWAGGAGSAAEVCFHDLEAIVDQYGQDDPDVVEFLRRCPETAVRLATIRAAGRWGSGAKVDLSDMEWGASLAWVAYKDLADRMLDFVPDNDRSKMIKRMAKWIRHKHAKQGRSITKREIQIYLGGGVKKLDFKDMLEHLVETGIIRAEGKGFVPR